MSTATQQEASTPTAVRNGDFVWYELRTTDLDAATSFYTHVVGWKAQGSGDPGGVPYTLLTTGGVGVAGAMQLSSEMQAGGMKPGWVGFIGVDDIDLYAHKVEQAGGELLCPVMDIPSVGRFAAAEDPQGAHFLLFKATVPEMPRPPFGAAGTIGWSELSANDEKGVWPFYSETFGWVLDTEMDMGPMGIYRIFNNGGTQMGAMMTRDPSRTDRPFWLFYFNVDDIDAARARIEEKNGNVCMGPHEVPGGLWIVVATDPQGALFALVGNKTS
jgi:uncharacterized protein